MPKIFISYRRDDSRKDSGRIYDRLIQAFGRNNIFKDIDDIPPGSDFRQVIVEEMSQCDTALVIIGQAWLNITDKNGKRRLDNPADFVRIEVETALARPNIRVIPVLVDNAAMPPQSDLPASLQNLIYRNAVVVRDDPDFHGDVTRLIGRLKSLNRTTLTGRPQPKNAPRPSFWMGGLVLLFVAVAGIIFLSGIFRQEDEKDGSELQATDEVTEITPIPTLTTREQAIQLAQAGVNSNDEWTPYSEVIDGVEMVLVPKGCFMMGSSDAEIDYALQLYLESQGEAGQREWFEDEQPQHEQCFDAPFWIDKYEVTNAQFRQFNGQAGRDSNRTQDNRPRESITWFEARDFCENRGVRLPTEKEWEYAARGVDSLIFPWGNEFVEDNVVYRSNTDETANVGSRQGGMSWVGALDLSGNVSEWVSTVYNEPYPYFDNWESKIDTNSERILRGGSFVNSTILVRMAVRNGGDPYGEDKLLLFGFRCASALSF